MRCVSDLFWNFHRATTCVVVDSPTDFPSVPPRRTFCCCGRRLEPGAASVMFVSFIAEVLFRLPPECVPCFFYFVGLRFFTQFIFHGRVFGRCNFLHARRHSLKTSVIVSFFRCIGRRRPVWRASRVGALAVLCVNSTLDGCLACLQPTISGPTCSSAVLFSVVCGEQVKLVKACMGLPLRFNVSPTKEKRHSYIPPTTRETRQMRRVVRISITSEQSRASRRYSHKSTTSSAACIEKQRYLARTVRNSHENSAAISTRLIHTHTKKYM